MQISISLLACVVVVSAQTGQPITHSRLPLTCNQSYRSTADRNSERRHNQMPDAPLYTRPDSALLPSFTGVCVRVCVCACVRACASVRVTQGSAAVRGDVYRVCRGRFRPRFCATADRPTGPFDFGAQLDGTSTKSDMVM